MLFIKLLEDDEFRFDKTGTNHEIIVNVGAIKSYKKLETLPLLGSSISLLSMYGNPRRSFRY